MIRTLTDRNLLIFTLYFIVVAYVLYRATNSVQDKVRLVLDRESLNKALEAEGLKNVLSVDFLLLKEYKLDELTQLVVIIQNKSQLDNIYVDWDRSSLTDLDGRSRRLIRMIPDMTSDVFQPLSVIPGGQILKENITTEDVLKRGSDGVLKVSSCLFDITKLKKSPRPDQKKKYADFMSRRINMQFSLRLTVRLVDSIHASQRDAWPGAQTSFAREDDTRIYTLPCDFTVDKQPWLEAVSWRPRLHPPIRS